LKNPFIRGVAFQLSSRTSLIRRNPTKKPIIGDENREISTFINPGIWTADHPSAITTAPRIPPTKAWEELLGNPRYQVNKSHRIALINAARITLVLIKWESTIPLPIVCATATPKMNGPENSATAVTPSATRGENARDEIIVATTLLESWMPLRRSNEAPITITAMSTGVKVFISP